MEVQSENLRMSHLCARVLALVQGVPVQRLGHRRRRCRSAAARLLHCTAVLKPIAVATLAKANLPLQQSAHTLHQAMGIGSKLHGFSGQVSLRSVQQCCSAAPSLCPCPCLPGGSRSLAVAAAVHERQPRHSDYRRSFARSCGVKLVSGSRVGQADL